MKVSRGAHSLQEKHLKFSLHGQDAMCSVSFWDWTLKVIAGWKCSQHSNRPQRPYGVAITLRSSMVPSDQISRSPPDGRSLWRSKRTSPSGEMSACAM